VQAVCLGGGDELSGRGEKCERGISEVGVFCVGGQVKCTLPHVCFVTERASEAAFTSLPQTHIYQLACEPSHVARSDEETNKHLTARPLLASPPLQTRPIHSGLFTAHNITFTQQHKTWPAARHAMQSPSPTVDRTHLARQTPSARSRCTTRKPPSRPVTGTAWKTPSSPATSKTWKTPSARLNRPTRPKPTTWRKAMTWEKPWVLFSTP